MKFVIPVKTERSRLINILSSGIFFQNCNNIVQLGILCLVLPVLRAQVINDNDRSRTNQIERSIFAI